MDAPRFSPVTEQDHAGQLWIVTILALTYGSLVAATRGYIKFRMYGLDDVLFAVAYVLQLAQCIVVFFGLGNGIGKFNSITPEEQWAKSSRNYQAAEILCLLGLAFSKCSVTALVLRIIGTKTSISRYLCMGLMALSIAWGVASCVGLNVNCRADTLLTVENVDQCPGVYSRWLAISIIDITTEFAILGLVVQLVYTVNMSVIRKSQVVLAFSFRIPLVALAGLHLHYLQEYPASPEPQFAITNALLLQQAMVFWSLTSATVPNVKNFLKSFHIGMGFPVAFDVSRYGSGGQAYVMHSMSSHGRSKQRSKLASSATAPDSSPSPPQNWRPDGVGHESTIEHAAREDELDKASRTGSQELIINKEVVWTVTYGDAGEGGGSGSDQAARKRNAPFSDGRVSGERTR